MSITNFHDDDLQVQILKPPFFEPTGIVVPRTEAWQKGLWYGTVNLWVVQTKPIPAIVYQQRALNIGWAPGKLDVLIAGHCENLQTPAETLAMEASEEMNVIYDQSTFISLGKKLSVGIGQDNSVRNSVVNLFLVEDNLPTSRFIMQKKEVHAVCVCPIDQILKVHSNKDYSYNQEILLHDGTTSTISIDQNSFPPNWDPYHHKMAFLIDRYFKGEKNLIY